MNSKIVTYDYLKNSDLAHVKVSDTFKQNLKNKIISEYHTLTNYNNQKLNIGLHTLALEFRKNKYFKFNRLLKITQDFGIPEGDVYNEISAWFARGSNTSKELILNKELEIDKFFVECYALYLAEGDNGSNGKTKPRKVRFTNSDLGVHKHFISWLKKYFPNNYVYFKVLVPHEKEFSQEDKDNIKKHLDLEETQVKTNACKWKRRTKIVYRTCLDNALLIDFILAIEQKIKEFCLADKNLAAAYIRGMMIGEGTAYFNKSRYVRIEMRNEKEIKYLHKLFTLLGFECEPSLRSNRENMWSLYISAKQLEKYNNLIGFGVHDERQNILEQGINKKLRVNQYC